MGYQEYIQFCCSVTGLGLRFSNWGVLQLIGGAAASVPAHSLRPRQRPGILAS